MKIPYLTSKKLASGEVAYYFNVPARLLPNGCPIKGSQALGKDYLQACQKALELYQKIQNFKNNEFSEEKSFNYLWTLYVKSRFFIELAPRTQKDYLRTKDLICSRKNKAGKNLADIPLDIFDSDSAYKLYETFVELFKQRWALNCISMLRMIYNFGMRKEILTKRNPFENMRIKHNKPQKLYIPAEHLQILINKALELNLPQVALAVALNFYICQRPADVLELRKKDLYQHGKYYFFNIVQNKTGANVHVPVPPQLIPEILSKNDYIICTSKGAPYSVNSFGRIFKKVNDACGFNYMFRLLRHSGSTALAEAGVDGTMAISITGHTDEKIFNSTYKANSERLSLYAMEKMLKREEFSQISQSFGKTKKSE